MAVKYTTLGQRVVWVLSAITITDLIGIVISWFTLGGDAVSGYSDKGTYFVGHHGTFTEVSRAAWIFSYIQVYGFLVNVLAAMAIFFWLWWSANMDLDQA